MHTSLSDIVFRTHTHWPWCSIPLFSAMEMRKYEYMLSQIRMAHWPVGLVGHRATYKRGEIFSYNADKTLCIVCSVHITTLVGFIRAPLTKLTDGDGDNVQQKKIFSAMPHEFSHRHKMTHPPEQNIKEEKSWKLIKWNGTECKSWHLKIRIVGCSVSTLSHTHARFASVDVSLGYKRMRKELGINHNSNGTRMSGK